MSNFTPAELHARLMQRASEDAEFRQALLADPRETLRREFGIEPPPTLAIKVEEQASGALTLSFPPLPDGELSEQHLETVVGGINLGGASFWQDFLGLLDLRQNVLGAGVIPAGAGNVIAAGGGNFLEANGANVITGGGGNVITGGGGNFQL